MTAPSSLCFFCSAHWTVPFLLNRLLRITPVVIALQSFNLFPCIKTFWLTCFLLITFELYNSELTDDSLFLSYNTDNSVSEISFFLSYLLTVCPKAMILNSSTSVLVESFLWIDFSFWCLTGLHYYSPSVLIFL